MNKFRTSHNELETRCRNLEDEIKSRANETNRYQSENTGLRIRIAELEKTLSGR